MSFNFDKLTNRFNTNSYKWDVERTELPMWVADMDFETAPAVIDAIQKRVDHRIFGYTTVPDYYYKAISQWWEKRHEFHIEHEWIMFCTGVVPAISSIVRKMTSVNDKILLLTPVYNIFYNSIINNQRKVLSSELVYQDNQYTIDFNDLEKKLEDPKTRLLIFCNPHNPIGKVWGEETLEKIGQLCIKNHVLILSDEIHCDLTHPGHRYVPFASVSSEIAHNCITCISPTKTFNLAGIQTSSIIVPNPQLRELVHRSINTDEVAEPNAFAIEATTAAFSTGDSWLAELLLYLKRNRELLERFITNHLPQLQVIRSEATYLAWIDCGRMTNDTKHLCEMIRKVTGLYVSEGAIFGGNGPSFIRMNFACPKARLEDGLQRLKQGVEAFQRL